MNQISFTAKIADLANFSNIKGLFSNNKAFLTFQISFYTLELIRYIFWAKEYMHIYQRVEELILSLTALLQLNYTTSLFPNIRPDCIHELLILPLISGKINQDVPRTCYRVATRTTWVNLHPPSTKKEVSTHIAYNNLPNPSPNTWHYNRLSYPLQIRRRDIYTKMLIDGWCAKIPKPYRASGLHPHCLYVELK